MPLRNERNHHGSPPDSHAFTEPVAFPHPDTHASNAAMIEAALYAAMGCAAISALAGNRASWVLLASALFCLWLDHLVVPFHPVLWMEFDCIAILLIVRRKMTHADAAILALFLPAWGFYQMDDPLRYDGTMSLVISQLLLSVSPEKIRSAPARYRAWFRSECKFDQLVAHLAGGLAWRAV